MATRYTAQQWREWFEEFERSGLTVARFCESIGVGVVTFYRWRRKLKRADSKGSARGKLIVASSRETGTGPILRTIELDLSPFPFPEHRIGRTRLE